MTLKEFMRRPHPELDRLADEAEKKRISDEEYTYDVRVCADYKHTHTAKSESGLDS